jgi:exosortase family protein XrtM
MKALISYKKEIGFLVCFAVFFIAGQALFFLVRPHTEHVLVHILNAKASSLIINTLTPKENTTTEGAEIRSGSLSITIEKGCEGIEGIILFIAAITAYHARGREKLICALAGIAAIYFFNLLRIISLYYIFKYRPEVFDVMHIFVGQTVIIFLSALLFLACINLSPQKTR